MWAWGCVERVATGLLGGPLAGGGRWNTIVAVRVTAAAGLAVVAIVVSSRCRGGLKSPWWRRRRKAPLTAQEWRGLFALEGKLQDGGARAGTAGARRRCKGEVLNCADFDQSPRCGCPSRVHLHLHPSPFSRKNAFFRSYFSVNLRSFWELVWFLIPMVDVVLRDDWCGCGGIGRRGCGRERGEGDDGEEAEGGGCAVGGFGQDVVRGVPGRGQLSLAALNARHRRTEALLPGRRAPRHESLEL